MPHRQPVIKPLPKIWLMTDTRFGDSLLAAIRKLPMRSGVVFRHYALAPQVRRALLARVRRVCVQRGHMLLLADRAALGRKWQGDGTHGRDLRVAAGLRSTSVHNVREIAEAKRNGADMCFLSPLRATRSHMGQRPLGPARFRQLAMLCRPAKVIALGGMTRAHAAKWQGKMIHGWAGIDAFIADQKRILVPT
jgi:thiamine-phosphate pyrophosphorylase